MTIRVAAILAAVYILVTPLGTKAAERTILPENDDLMGYVASMSDRHSSRRLVIACSRGGRVLILMSGRKIATVEDEPTEVHYSFDGAPDINETWKGAHPHGIQTEGVEALSFILKLKTARSNLLFADGAGATVNFALNGGAGRVMKATVALCETLWEKSALRA